MPLYDEDLLLTFEKMLLDLDTKFHPNLRMNLSEEMSNRLDQRVEIYNHLKTLIKEENYTRDNVKIEIEKEIGMVRNKLDILAELQEKISSKPSLI